MSVSEMLSKMIWPKSTLQERAKNLQDTRKKDDPPHHSENMIWMRLHFGFIQTRGLQLIRILKIIRVFSK